jgi:hypothetical protein
LDLPHFSGNTYIFFFFFFFFSETGNISLMEILALPKNMKQVYKLMQKQDP